MFSPQIGTSGFSLAVQQGSTYSQLRPRRGLFNTQTARRSATDSNPVVPHSLHDEIRHGSSEAIAVLATLPKSTGNRSASASNIVSLFLAEGISHHSGRPTVASGICRMITDLQTSSDDDKRSLLTHLVDSISQFPLMPAGTVIVAPQASAEADSDSAAEALPVQLQDADRAALMSALGGLLPKASLKVMSLVCEALCRLTQGSLGDECVSALVRSTPALLLLLRQNPEPRGDAVAAVFFATSVLARMACYPDMAQVALELDALRILTDAMDVAPPQIAMATTHTIWKLVKENKDGRTEALLGQLVELGAFPKLCAVLQQVDGPANDMAFALLVDMCELPAMQQYITQDNNSKHVVQALKAAASSDGRLKAVIVACRLAAKNVPCQLDLVRNGVAEPLVDMVWSGSTAERTHASRLSAILAQHPSTHDALLRNTPLVQRIIEMLASEDADSDMLVHAASAIATIAHNPDTHYLMVNWGLVPAMSPLLTRGPPGARVFVLSTMLLLALHEARHAAVLVRAGGVMPLVVLAREAQSQHQVREYAAAVLSQLSRHMDLQQEVVNAGGIPAMVRLLNDGSPEAQTHAAEALAQMCSASSVRKRLVARTGALQPLISMMTSKEQAVQYWGANLLQVLGQDPSVLGEAMELGLLPVLEKLLARRSEEPCQELQRTQASAAWLVARLAGQSALSSRLLDSCVVRHLVELLREAQAAEAASQDSSSSWLVMEGLEHNMGAASTAALLALARSSEEHLRAILGQLTLQLWCGYNVRLQGLHAMTHTRSESAGSDTSSF